MSEMVKIDKDIPLPKIRGGPEGKLYPWDTMEIGDSFLHQGAYTTATTSANKKGMINGRKFACRKTPDGIRIWRVA